ncbi:hypothetical protein BLNAU_12248 [Blattamonas nauphoetae]|uniref:Gamma tubulin complex component C-terminal domain-containing protein n=1 Tax=Blattamonas nauphoetae TaxID=2049346 RepID=A0ABQ9XRD0_9EUKA|nr:hypothetical protein BLNAU_12248 [Blattamonas nauphoetae]
MHAFSMSLRDLLTYYHQRIADFEMKLTFAQTNLFQEFLICVIMPMSQLLTPYLPLVKYCQSVLHETIAFPSSQQSLPAVVASHILSSLYSIMQRFSMLSSFQSESLEDWVGKGKLNPGYSSVDSIVPHLSEQALEIVQNTLKDDLLEDFEEDTDSSLADKVQNDPVDEKKRVRGGEYQSMADRKKSFRMEKRIYPEDQAQSPEIDLNSSPNELPFVLPPRAKQPFILHKNVSGELFLTLSLSVHPSDPCEPVCPPFLFCMMNEAVSAGYSSLLLSSSTPSHPCLHQSPTLFKSFISSLNQTARLNANLTKLPRQPPVFKSASYLLQLSHSSLPVPAPHSIPVAAPPSIRPGLPFDPFSISYIIPDNRPTAQQNPVTPPPSSPRTKDTPHTPSQSTSLKMALRSHPLVIGKPKQQSTAISPQNLTSTSIQSYLANALFPSHTTPNPLTITPHITNYLSPPRITRAVENALFPQNSRFPLGGQLSNPISPPFSRSTALVRASIPKPLSIPEASFPVIPFAAFHSTLPLPTTARDTTPPSDSSVEPSMFDKLFSFFQNEPKRLEEKMERLTQQRRIENGLDEIQSFFQKEARRPQIEDATPTQVKPNIDPLEIATNPLEIKSNTTHQHGTIQPTNLLQATIIAAEDSVQTHTPPPIANIDHLIQNRKDGETTLTPHVVNLSISRPQHSKQSRRESIPTPTQPVLSEIDKSISKAFSLLPVFQRTGEQTDTNPVSQLTQLDLRFDTTVQNGIQANSSIESFFSTVPRRFRHSDHSIPDALEDVPKQLLMSPLVPPFSEPTHRTPSSSFLSTFLQPYQTTLSSVFTPSPHISLKTQIPVEAYPFLVPIMDYGADTAAELEEERAMSNLDVDFSQLTISLPSFITVSLSRPFYSLALQSNRALINTLFQNDLVSVLNTLRTVFFFQNGDAMHTFIFDLFSTVVNSSTRDLPPLFDLNRQLRFTLDACGVNSDGLALAFHDEGSEEGRDPSPLIRLVETLSLTFRTPSDLKVVVNTVSLKQYDMVFSRFLLLKCGLWATLHSVLPKHFGHIVLRPPPNPLSTKPISPVPLLSTPAPHKLATLRFNILGTVTSIHTTFLSLTVEKPWSQFKTMLDEANPDLHPDSISTLASIVIAHQTYLKNILDRSGLGKQATVVTGAIKNLINLAVQFFLLADRLTDQCQQWISDTHSQLVDDNGRVQVTQDRKNIDSLFEIPSFLSEHGVYYRQLFELEDSFTKNKDLLKTIFSPNSPNPALRQWALFLHFNS